jgi:hypothetical protein
MVVAVKATFTRWMGEVSLVATATTLRARPLGPSDSSRNCRTSLPRSPTSARTFTSASLLRAISPSSVLFPTPLPEKMPIRCPRPQVSRPSKQRRPKIIGSVIGLRCRGGVQALSSERKSVPSMGPRSSMGRPRASMTRPSIAGPSAM